tara:strand:+ start:2223 stop:2384 length:162 start_codon:yes stop_codon:yes gene_type:complete
MSKAHRKESLKDLKLFKILGGGKKVKIKYNLIIVGANLTLLFLPLVLCKINKS